MFVTCVPFRNAARTHHFVPIARRPVISGGAGKRQFSSVDGELLRDYPLAEHEVTGAVDAVGANKLSLTEVEAGEVAVSGRVSAEDDFVVTGVQTGDLELEIILIRPEPWKRRYLLGLPTHRRGSDLGLLVRARHRLQA